MDVIESVLVVNPLQLVDAVEAAWEATLARLRSDANVHHQIEERIRRVFRVDFEADRTWAQNR